MCKHFKERLLLDLKMEFSELLYLRKMICSDYINFYSCKDYEIEQPLPLKTNYDPTLYFTNCTICSFKEKYIKGKSQNNYCLVQKCIRTNTYDNMHKCSYLKYTSSIYMLGGFKKTDNKNFITDYNQCIISQASFLRRWISEEKRIIVETPNIIFDNGLLLDSTINLLNSPTTPR